MSFWIVNILQSSSSCRRKLLNLRFLAKQFLRFKVGSGSSIFLWYDWWHPEGILYEKFGHLVIYDAGGSLDDQVSNITMEDILCGNLAKKGFVGDILCFWPELH